LPDVSRKDGADFSDQIQQSIVEININILYMYTSNLSFCLFLEFVNGKVNISCYLYTFRYVFALN